MRIEMYEMQQVNAALFETDGQPELDASDLDHYLFNREGRMDAVGRKVADATYGNNGIGLATAKRFSKNGERRHS